MKALWGGRIFDGDTILEESAVLIDDGVVVKIINHDDLPSDILRVNLGGRLLVPGFVDVQVNGGGGVMVDRTLTPERLAVIAATHRQFGTTAFLPTLISDDLDAMVIVAEVVRTVLEQKQPGVIGIHFEGPLLNVERKGIHNPDRIRPIDSDLMALYRSAGLGACVVTLAPEVIPTGTIADLTEHRIRVCAGHTAATYEQIKPALGEGLAGFTHLFNAMTPMESRAPGVVGAALEDANSWCGLIVDGHHIHAATLRCAIKAKAAAKMMLITDAMPSVGSEVREFELYGRKITVTDERCEATDGTLAGSHLDMATAVRNTVEMVGLPLEEALRMASKYPAEFLGLGHQMGRIAAGYRADFALLDDDLRVTETWINGDEK